MAILKRSQRMRLDAAHNSAVDVVSDPAGQKLAEDAVDLEIFEERRHEPSLDFEDVLVRLGD